MYNSSDMSRRSSKDKKTFRRTKVAFTSRLEAPPQAHADLALHHRASDR
jgi:hypothetical protein